MSFFCLDFKYVNALIKVQFFFFLINALIFFLCDIGNGP
jgi:hypothetical protein